MLWILTCKYYCELSNSIQNVEGTHVIFNDIKESVYGADIEYKDIEQTVGEGNDNVKKFDIYPI